jgi:anti-sigma-K factor RskA
MISTQQGVAKWVIIVNNQKMHMHTVGQVAPPAGRSYELWILLGSGAKPVSLGVLPASGEASEQLSKTMLAALKSAQGLAVSIEPRGGSPTGQPTGSVVFTASIVNL